MATKLKIFLTLFILSFINCLSKDDFEGALISLLFVPMVFMAAQYHPPEDE